MSIIRYIYCDRVDYKQNPLSMIQFSQSPFPLPNCQYFTSNIRITLPGGYFVCGHERAYPGYKIDTQSNDLYFHWCISGKGTYNGIPFSKNDVFIVHQGNRKTMVADPEDPWEICWCVWKGEIADIASSKFNHYEDTCIYSLENNPDLFPLFSYLIYQPHRERRILKIVNGFVDLMLSDCHMMKKNTNEKSSASSHRVILEIQNYINDHFRDTNVEQIARHFHYNRKYITRIFHEYTGMTLCDYIRDTKLRCAESYLITSSLPVEEIAFLSGYSNYSTFIKAFKKKNGITPTEFMKLFH